VNCPDCGVKLEAVPWADDRPDDMVIEKHGKRLFVSNANGDSVSVIYTTQGKVLETPASALYPHAPVSSTHNFVRLTKDEDFLFIANADRNNLAVSEIRPG